jgi:regulatory protein
MNTYRSYICYIGLYVFLISSYDLNDGEQNMIVSELVPYDKKRTKVYIDGEYAFMLYKGEIRDQKIKVNEEITDETYDYIMNTVLSKRCKLRAMNLLQKKDYTEYKLREKLRDGQYPAAIIDIAVDYVKSYKYVDDERYARDYIKYYMDLRSKKRIMQDLTGKGIDKTLLNTVIEELYEEADPDIELDQAIKLLKKKNYDKSTADMACKQKLMGFLFRKGFSMDVIRKALALDTDYE